MPSYITKGIAITWVIVTCKLLIMWAESILETMGYM